MTNIILFHAPGACSRVTMNALEEIGLLYEDRAIDIFTGAQRSAEYRTVNPKGKVPALKIGDRVHTENAAILYFLNLQYPQARLLPASSEGVAENECLEDLVWCSGTIHPMVRQVRMPMRFTDGDPAGVKAHGMNHLSAVLDQVEQRISRAGWWYGDRWSIVDVYLYWNYSTAASGGLDLSRWPALISHGERVRDRPSFKRALARETAAVERGGIKLPPGARL
jgi:glutathione S-transferase